MTPRKHSELIKLWADGAEIEVKYHTGKWIDITEPAFQDECEYRLKPTPVIVPLTFEDRDKLRGKWVRAKRHGTEFLVNAINKTGVWILSTEFSYQNLFDNYTFLDGSPCGKNE